MSPEREFTEDKDPGTGLAPVKESAPLAKMKAGAQRALAYASLGIVAALYGTLLCAFLTDVITLDELTKLATVFSPLPTLCTVAFAFYFAKAD